jgi:hypothetical protein
MKSPNPPRVLPLPPLLNTIPLPCSPTSLDFTRSVSLSTGSSPSDSSHRDHVETSSDRTVYLTVSDIDEILVAINDNLLAFWSKTEIAAVVKLMIKKLEPFKQTKFPYKEGDKQKPTWWPESLHREPDHLGKPAVRELFLHLIGVTMFHFARRQGIEPEVSDHSKLEKADLSTSNGMLDHPRPFTYLTQELTHNACWADRPAQTLDPETRRERNRVLDEVWAILQQYEAYCMGESSKYIMICQIPDCSLL